MSLIGPSKIDFGRPTGILNLWGGRLTQRLDLRALLVSAVVVAIAIAVALVTLTSGEFQIAVPEVVGALFGQATAKVHMVVVEWRLPRTSLALIMGAALGISGAIFQSLTRNPLGSPDVIGFDSGAYTGALIVIIVLKGTFYAVAGGALLGGIITALVVYLLAWRGGVQGFRLIIVGIGISAMLNSFNTYLLIRADLEVAMAAAIWGVGSLNGMTLERLAQVCAVLAVLVPAAFFISRPMRQIEMGDDAARSLGVNAEWTRLAMTIVGVALTATVTAAAGPIAFVALAAPQIAMRLTKSAGVALLPSAATGALLLGVADCLAQRAFAPTQLPVGIVTICIGGLYFAWLLMREARR
ncbi:MAG: iron chelate uptake ABC transporter family permease subunit [Devosia sp.]|uniref:FecCD family ABC transporter permease n=1 Tax=Devosia sp. 66-22 TaxID=1895753 RepID=UPI00092C1C2F|nr:iron chelate uptake ABC transporter family permease subunit [Devosia sp. 66-22]MBN9347233.1 iron chelate uptake ABC transporter family permease subunit [Devosia sp.]OJX49305.1 MAG: iron ABC transporter permease [Devosia sp. 66-22]